jgi:hypothetical protein
LLRPRLDHPSLAVHSKLLEPPAIAGVRTAGTNTGGAFWFGVAANDRSIDFESWAMLEDGKVTESWGLNDGMTALIQLGTWEPAPMPSA